MRAQDFEATAPGQLVAINSQGHVAFEPNPLPPEIHIDAELARVLASTERVLGRLDGRGQGLARPYILIQPFIRREALASSRIEGTTAVIEDLLRYEAGERDKQKIDDVREVANYLTALQYGLNREEGREFSLSFLNELHHLLLNSVRGAERHPGQLRQIQVVIGKPGATTATARFVPPPPTAIRGLLENLISWIHATDGLPELIRLALMHYQFETIHPYEDGNGRLGRLLITLLLDEWNMMEFPLLYLSEYFERHKPAYLDHLLAVSQRGAWKDWIMFFLTAVQHQAGEALVASTQLITYREELRSHYQQGRTPAHVLNIIDQLFIGAVVSIPLLSERLGISNEQVQRAIRRIVSDGVVEEITGRDRNRLYIASTIMRILYQRTQDET